MTPLHRREDCAECDCTHSSHEGARAPLDEHGWHSVSEAEWQSVLEYRAARAPLDTVFAGPHNGCTYERAHVHPEDSPEEAEYLAEARAPLDVERLARAIVEVEESRLCTDCLADVCEVHEEFYAASIGCGDAAAIAREYAALEEPTNE